MYSWVWYYISTIPCFMRTNNHLLPQYIGTNTLMSLVRIHALCTYEAIMPPKRISQEVIDDVRRFWSNSDKETSARKLYDEYIQTKIGRKPLKLRKFQQIVADAIANTPKDPFPLLEWRRWGDTTVTSEGMAYLLKLDAICLAACGRPLWDHEAKWGSRLRASLDGLALYYQLCFVLIYALMQESAYHLNSGEPVVQDLDLLVAYQPWISEDHQRVYLRAASSAGIPVTLFLRREEIEQFTGFEVEIEGMSSQERIHTILPHWRIVLRVLSPLPTDLTVLDEKGELHDDPTINRILQFWAGKQAEAI